MSYINTHQTLTMPASIYVDRNWVYSRQTNFLKKHILARSAHCILSPASFITAAVDTIIGFGAGVGAICSRGKHLTTFKVAFNHLASSEDLLADPYANILRTINPTAKISRNSLLSQSHVIRTSEDPNDKPPMISGDGNGLTSHEPIRFLKTVARSCYNSDNSLERHVASRLTYALLLISCLVTRAVDGIISVPAAALSILTAGKFETLNNLAYRALKAPGIINDLFYCTVKFINPWAGVRLSS